MSSFLKKYILHHLLLGIIMVIEGILLLFDNWVIRGLFYLIIGIILFIDDLLAETIDKSMMKFLPEKIQEENNLKLIGLIIFIIVTAWFVYLWVF
ncbi:MAG: hypothetical protein GF329_09525 [Candidatus Lokiarchaeota archaeon]|nr:hypothetical protein [Candidatus Lokiarchaeota archaeon]